MLVNISSLSFLNIRSRQQVPASVKCVWVKSSRHLPVQVVTELDEGHSKHCLVVLTGVTNFCECLTEWLKLQGQCF